LGGTTDNLSTNVSLENNTVDFTGTSFSTSLGKIDPSADRTINLPNATGTISLIDNTETLTNKTLQDPNIQDSNSADFLIFSGSGSAVNEITVSNANTGGSPSFIASGDDAEINLQLQGKGNGSVNSEKLSLGNETITADGSSVSTTKSFTIFNSGTALPNITLTDGQVVGEIKNFVNQGAGAVTMTPASFTQGTSITITTYGSLTMIWDGSNWYVTGTSPTAVSIS